MGRKTIEIGKIVEQVNRVLKTSSKDRVERRLAYCELLDFILLDSDSYKGYRYLGQNEVVDGNPGIRYSNEGYPLTYELDKVDTSVDTSRRHYYC
jgi:hypothetical protein